MIDQQKLTTTLDCLEVVAQDNISYSLKNSDPITKNRGEGQMFVIGFLRETFLCEETKGEGEE